MPSSPMGPDITRSALIIVDMQNDFLHPDGSFGRGGRAPRVQIDMPFLVGTIPHVKRLADAFRAAGRPVVYVAHVLKPIIRTPPSPTGGWGYSRARETARTASRGRGVSRSSTS